MYYVMVEDVVDEEFLFKFVVSIEVIIMEFVFLVVVLNFVKVNIVIQFCEFFLEFGIVFVFVVCFIGIWVKRIGVNGISESNGIFIIFVFFFGVMIFIFLVVRGFVNILILGCNVEYMFLEF